jgi:hypothetical protein
MGMVQFNHVLFYIFDNLTRIFVALVLLVDRLCPTFRGHKEYTTDKKFLFNSLFYISSRPFVNSSTLLFPPALWFAFFRVLNLML